MIRRAWSNEKIRYLIIGGYNTLFGYACFALLWQFFGHIWHYLIILCISHILAVTNAYFGYKIFVFRNSPGGWRAFVTFNTVYIGAFLLNLLALPILIEMLNFHPLLAQFIIISATVVASYLLHRTYTFAGR